MNRRCYSCCRWHYRFCYWQTFCLCLCLVHCATQKTFQYLYCCTNTNGTLENGREKKGGWFDHLDMKALGKKNKKNNKTIVDRKSWIRSIHIVWSFNFSFTARFMGTHHIYIGIFQETITLSDKMRMGTSGKEQKYSRQQRNQKKYERGKNENIENHVVNTNCEIHKSHMRTNSICETFNQLVETIYHYPLAEKYAPYEICFI